MATPIQTGSSRSRVESRPVTGSWLVAVVEAVLTERRPSGRGVRDWIKLHRVLSIWRERVISIVVCQYGHPSIQRDGQQ